MASDYNIKTITFEAKKLFILKTVHCQTYVIIGRITYLQI